MDRKLLVVDTSGPVCGVAVMEGTRVLCEYTVQNRNTHSVNLLAMIDEALNRAGTTIGEMDALAAVAGPGSFTGVRIGVATVKGLAHGSGARCVAVNALEALARGAGFFDGLICPMQDARAGQVYGAAFEGKRRVLPDQALKLEDWLSGITAAGRPGSRFLFVGDGVAPHREAILEALGDRAVFAPAHLCYLRPAAAGMIAQESAETVDYLSLREYYLRPPNAQKNKKLMEAAARG